MTIEELTSLQADPRSKRQGGRSFRLINLGLAGILGMSALVALPGGHETQRIMRVHPEASVTSHKLADAHTVTNTITAKSISSRRTDPDALTVSGYIINSSRIQISPRFLGVVQWIGVKKGDPVHKGEVLARLDDREYKAKLVQAEGVLACEKVAVEKAELEYKRVHELAVSRIASQEYEDNARLDLEKARASLEKAQGARDEAEAFVDWCTIRSPIDGVVVQKLVDPDEVVMPQSLGNADGPSTAVLAVARERELQVEIDVNESDLSKVAMDQKCLVSSVAYPNRVYKGHVAEIATEANRAKGTLQVKVQIEQPDRFLRPELSAKVKFIQRADGSQVSRNS